MASPRHTAAIIYTTYDIGSGANGGFSVCVPVSARFPVHNLGIIRGRSIITHEVLLARWQILATRYYDLELRQESLI